MLLKSILNRIQLHHGFVYGSIRLVEKAKRLLLEIDIRSHKGSRPVCSVCGRSGLVRTPCRFGDLNLFHCGASPYSSYMPCGELIVLAIVIRNNHQELQAFESSIYKHHKSFQISNQFCV